MRNAGRLAIPTEDLPDGPDHRPGPEETVVAYIEAKRALALLARLPVQQRELLVLRVLTGLSAEETGHELGMPGRSCPGRPAPRAHAAPGDSAGGMDRLTRRRGRDEAARALG